MAPERDVTALVSTGWPNHHSTIAYPPHTSSPPRTTAPRHARPTSRASTRSEAGAEQNPGQHAEVSLRRARPRVQRIASEHGRQRQPAEQRCEQRPGPARQTRSQPTRQRARRRRRRSTSRPRTTWRDRTGTNRRDRAPPPTRARRRLRGGAGSRPCRGTPPPAYPQTPWSSFRFRPDTSFDQTWPDAAPGDAADPADAGEAGAVDPDVTVCSTSRSGTASAASSS